MQFSSIIRTYKRGPVQEDHLTTVEKLARKIAKASAANGHPLSTEKKFYVYVYLDPTRPGPYTFNLRSGKTITTSFCPFYFGKGTDTPSKKSNGRQRRSHKHLKEAKRVHNKRKRGLKVTADRKTNKITSLLDQGVLPTILKSHLMTEAEAFAREIIFIDGIGRIKGGHGPLLNLTDGGDGVTGHLHSPEHAPVQSIKFTFNGETKTLREWSAETGVSAGILRKRIDKGVEPHRVINSGTVRAAATTLTAKGRRLTFTEWGAETGLRPKTIRKRLKRGWSPEGAVTP